MRKLRLFILLTVILSITAADSCVFADDSAFSDTFTGLVVEFTDEEREFISENPVIHMSALDGIAPLIYENSDGTMHGIIPNIYGIVSNITGLEFTYELCQNWDELKKTVDDKSVDMIAVSDTMYEEAFGGLHITPELLSAKTILYINSSLEAHDIFASEEDAEEFLSSGDADMQVLSGGRLESLIAVNNGEADYAFGNEYSVYFYRTVYNLSNISIVPISQDERSYHSVFVNTDPLLESIITKVIEAIPEATMSGAIIDGTIAYTCGICHAVPQTIKAFGFYCNITFGSRRIYAFKRKPQAQTSEYAL